MNNNSENRYSKEEVVTKGGITYLKIDMKPVKGVRYSTYENGQLSEEGNWIDGKEDGLYRWWYENRN